MRRGTIEGMRTTATAMAAGLLVVSPACKPAPAQEIAPPPEAVEFQIVSPCLSAFWGRDVTVEAMVVEPADRAPGEELPLCYSVHGFGGNHRSGGRQAPELIAAMRDAGYPRMIYVFLNAQCPMGHHVFADSVNNGPWGRALTSEFLPALEERYAPYATAEHRFLTGHSSGGWSSLWLQVSYPRFFAGTWSTAPDSVDFRDFTGIDVYDWDNAYVDPEGQEVSLMRRNGEWVMTVRQFATMEHKNQPLGGQFYSFNAVFSPRSEDGTPMPMFDWQTGAIDPRVRASWRQYDISWILRTRWDELEPDLAGKIHVWIGSQDTFRLEGATLRMQQELDAIAADVDILVVEGRDHGTLFAPHEEFWPDGLLSRIHQEMRAQFDE